MQILNVHQRIREIMKDVDYIQKGDKKVNNMYKFVSHDQVAALFHSQFVKHGIVVLPSILEMKQDGNRTEVLMELTFVNVDQPDDRFMVTYGGYGIDPADKGPGKAVSYAYKYALLKTFCLETGDDPDEEQTSKYEAKEEEKWIDEKQQKTIEAALKQYDINWDDVKGKWPLFNKMEEVKKDQFIPLLQNIKKHWGKK